MTSDPELTADVALTVFELNGQLLAAAEGMTRDSGLTAAWWQVVGAVLREPLPVSGIARAMGVTRQSVQRIAAILVDRGLAEYLPNPAHRRAKLLRPTDAGYEAVRRIAPHQAAFSARLASELGPGELASTLATLRRLSAALEAIEDDGDAGPVDSTD